MKKNTKRIITAIAVGLVLAWLSTVFVPAHKTGTANM